MALERRDPLPPGRYAIFIRQDEEAKWAEWLAANKATVSLVVSIPKRAVASNTAVFSITFTGDVIENYVGRAELFDVTTSTPWVGLGYPDIETTTTIEQFAKRELDDGVICYWVWTTAGPEVVCDRQGPDRISLVATAAPWLLAAFLGWVFITGRKSR